MDTTLEKKRIPPYLALGRLAKLIQLISSRTYTEINANQIATHGFGKADSYLSIAALRFLNLIDDNGITNNNLIKKFQLLGDQRKEEISKIIKESYSDLFKVANSPQSLPPDELTNEFLNIYKLTPRVAGPAVRCFLWLCELAGLKEVTTKIRERSSTTVRKNKVLKEASKSISDNKILMNSGGNKSFVENEYFTFDFDEGVKLLVPKKDKIDQVIAQGELKPVADEIKGFIKKFFKKQSSPFVDDKTDEIT